MSKRLIYIIIIFVILLSGFILQRKYINEFPKYIHAWAQADHYALALGFLDNKMDFFHPQTYNLNRQFPGDFNVPYKTANTSVDFPIHNYVAALIMKIFHTKSPWCFRLYLLMYSFIGLFFLFKISELIGLDFYKSILLIVIAITSPVYAYYQAGFLPTIPCLANAFIGIYFYLRYLKQGDIGSFAWSILFFTLATLSRTPYSIILISVLGVEFLNIIKTKRYDMKKLFFIIISLGCIIGYFLYNNYLRDKFGSLFLNHPRTPESLAEISSILQDVFKSWRFNYFTKIHYFIFAILIINWIYHLASKKLNLNHIQKQLLLLVSIITLGSLLYSYLMLLQFIDHDYYFLDTLYLPIILYVLILISLIPQIKKKRYSIYFNVALLILTSSLVIKASNTQVDRRGDYSWDVISNSISNFIGSKAFLDSNGIKKDAVLLDLCSFSPNISFILMDRKGYVTMSFKKEKIDEQLKWPYDCIVYQNDYFLSMIYTNYPDIINKLNPIANNGKITICKLEKEEKEKKLNDYLGLKKPLKIDRITFDSNASKLWENIKLTKVDKYSGKASGFVNEKDDNGLTYKLKDVKEFKNKCLVLNLKSMFKAKSANVRDIKVVVLVTTNGKEKYNREYNIDTILKERDKWYPVDLMFQLPEMETENTELVVLVKNTGHNYICFDDFEIDLY